MRFAVYMACFVGVLFNFELFPIRCWWARTHRAPERFAKPCTLDKQKKERRKNWSSASRNEWKKNIWTFASRLCFGYYLQTILDLIVVEVQARAVATDTHLLDIVISRFLIRFLLRFTFRKNPFCMFNPCITFRAAAGRAIWCIIFYHLESKIMLLIIIRIFRCRHKPMKARRKHIVEMTAVELFKLILDFVILDDR